MNVCPQCKKQIPDGSLHCVHCGVRLEYPPEARTQAVLPGVGVSPIHKPARTVYGYGESIPPATSASSQSVSPAGSAGSSGWLEEAPATIPMDTAPIAEAVAQRTRAAQASSPPPANASGNVTSPNPQPGHVATQFGGHHAPVGHALQFSQGQFPSGGPQVGAGQLPGVSSAAGVHAEQVQYPQVQPGQASRGQYGSQPPPLGHAAPMIGQFHPPRAQPVHGLAAHQPGYGQAVPGFAGQPGQSAHQPGYGQAVPGYAGQPGQGAPQVALPATLPQEPRGKKGIDPGAYAAIPRAILGAEETEAVKPLRPPSNARSAAASVVLVSDSTATVMLVLGLLLLACFAAPWVTTPGQTVFAWTILTDGAISTQLRVLPLIFALSGLLAILFGVVHISSRGRAAVAALVGGLALAGVYVTGHPGINMAWGGGFGGVTEFDWRHILSCVGTVSLMGGLFLRANSPASMAARAAVTAGVVLVVIPGFVSPSGFGIVETLALFNASKIPMPFVMTCFTLLVLAASLLVWLPPTMRTGARVTAYIVALLPLLIIAVALSESPSLELIKADLVGFIYLPLGFFAWALLSGYGLSYLVVSRGRKT